MDLGDHLVQGAALDLLHGEEQSAIGQPAELVDGHDSRVFELGSDLGLVDEADQLLRLMNRVKPVEPAPKTEAANSETSGGAHFPKVVVVFCFSTVWSKHGLAYGTNSRFNLTKKLR